MGEQMDKEAILTTQQLNLIYPQSCMLYKILPNVARAEMDPMKATSNPHADGVIGSAIGQVMS